MTSDRATVDAVEQRLLEWAAWMGAGRLAQGYPTRSPLHMGWLPPGPGGMPVMRVAKTARDVRERETDRCVRALSIRLQDTLVVRYLQRHPVATQADLLECQVSTVHARVAEAKRLIARMLDAAVV